AENIVAQRLAACVNILPQVRSIYHWEGNIESAEESLLLIKSHVDKFDSLQNTIVNIHPYEVPEIISLDIKEGLPSYLNWLSSSIFDKRN
ncbi:MAG: divalent-cation tolerance protein CutA, partial [Gammaproteobacteria bacterium]|nr:divalent-cation tolerance protein CutA [Gammaproteobacteria bacterium]